MRQHKRKVNVILQSTNALPGSTRNNSTYNVDWGAILKNNIPYKLTWTYVGRVNSSNSNTKIAQVQIDFVMQQYLNTNNIYGAPSSTHIGCLRQFYLAQPDIANMYLYADENNNPPIYLENRPNNNTFSVRVMNNDTTPTLWTDRAGSNNAHYTLVLQFEEI